MKFRRQLLGTSATWAILALFMALTTPGKLPVVMLIVPFILLYIALYSTWNLIGVLKNRFFASKPSSARKPRGMALSLSAVLLLVLQSLGQLTLRDVITLLAIVTLGYLYLARSRFEIPKR